MSTGDAGAECRRHCCEAELWWLQDHPPVQHPTAKAGGGEHTGKNREAVQLLFKSQKEGAGELVKCDTYSWEFRRTSTLNRRPQFVLIHTHCSILLWMGSAGILPLGLGRSYGWDMWGGRWDLFLVRSYFSENEERRSSASDMCYSKPHFCCSFWLDRLIGFCSRKKWILLYIFSRVIYSSFASGNYNYQLYCLVFFVGSFGSIGACLTNVSDFEKLYLG